MSAIWERAGITKSAYLKRLKRWGDPDLAGSQPRYERVPIPKVFVPKVGKQRPSFYRKPPTVWPMTAEQVQVCRALRAWR